MDKTIKQIADDLGVSKTAVRKKIDNLGLRSSLRKNGNQFVINKTQEKAIITAFNRKDKTETGSQTSQTETETISALISMLQNELEMKNKQIKELNERLTENQRLLDQEQQLHAMTKQELKRLEVKDEAPEPEEPEPQKKSWLNFFRKGNT